MSAESAEGSGSRALWLACAGLGAAAVLLWAGSATIWYVVAPPGRSPVELIGSRVSAAPGGTALLALAGVAALVAAGGLLRRAVGLLLALAGFLTATIAVQALLGNPFATDAPDSALPQPPPGVSLAALRHQPTDTTWAPLLATAGAVLMVGVGVFVLLREARLPRLGARFGARPGGRPRRAELDPDRAAWQELDAGRDPTLDEPDDPGNTARPTPPAGAPG